MTAKATDYIPRVILEPEPRATWSGLLNADGVKLYRIEEKKPIGFVWGGE